MLEGLSIEALGSGGAMVALVVSMILWRVFKLAVKIVLFVVLMASLALGALLYFDVLPKAALEYGRPAPSRP